MSPSSQQYPDSILKIHFCLVFTKTPEMESLRGCLRPHKVHVRIFNNKANFPKSYGETDIYDKNLKKPLSAFNTDIAEILVQWMSELQCQALGVHTMVLTPGRPKG